MKTERKAVRAPAKKSIRKKKTAAEKKAEIVAENTRQALCVAYFTDPKSETFGNMRQSALAAGFSEEYADNITALRPKWLSEIIGHNEKLLEKASANLDHFLSIDYTTKIPMKRGKKTVLVTIKNDKFAKLKQNSTHFVMEKLHPHFRPEKREVKQGPGVAVQINIADDKLKYAA